MFEPRNDSPEAALEYLDILGKTMHMTALYMSDWIPNAKTKEDALLFAQAVEYNVSKISNKNSSWQTIITEAYKAGKSVEAFNKLVEYGLLEYPV